MSRHSEAEFRRRRAATMPIGPLRVFYHISCMAGWEDSVTETFRLLAHAGIRDVYGVVIGSPKIVELARSLGVNYHLLGISSDFSLCERPTLEHVGKYARANPDAATLYMHSKGVSRPTDAIKIKWRRLMQKHLVLPWDANHRALTEYDMVGCFWQRSRDYPHFAGNFWMARNDWLASLQEINAYRDSRPDFLWAHQSWRGRMYCESWAGSAPWHHIKSLLGFDGKPWDEKWLSGHSEAIPGFTWGPTPPVERKGHAHAVRFDRDNLASPTGEHLCNGSILPYQDGYLLACRSGRENYPSRILVSRLDGNMRPTGDCRKLALSHPACSYSQEDPRLFMRGGQLHVSFTGTEHVGGELVSNCLYARLNDAMGTEALWHPAITNRQPWEKNHAYFEWQGELYAVYSIRPHRILKIDGDRADWAFETPGPPQWLGGIMRGGAPPVRVGEYYYHWFHGRTDNGPGRNVGYQIGVVKFEAAPPFKVVAYTLKPIVEAVPEWSNDYGADVVFVCGAFRERGDWLVSLGIADRWVEIRRFDANWVDNQLLVNM